MAGFTIYITPVITQNNLEHTATSWQISEKPDFSELLIDDQEDKENLLSLRVDLPLTKDDVYYVRHKLHFSDGRETDWSRPSVVTKNGDGFSFNNTIIITPKVWLDDISNVNTPLGGFKIKTSDFTLFMGVGNHLATDWIIEDSEGTVIWERLRDKHNLTGIRLPADILKPGKAYYLKVRHISDTNSVSNYGKLLIITDPKLSPSSVVSGTTDDTLLQQNAELLDRVRYLEEQLNETLSKLVACTIGSSLCYDTEENDDTENN